MKSETSNNWEERVGKKGVRFELIISFLALIIAILTAYVTYGSLRQSGQIAKFQAFLMLRSEFEEIRKKFPLDYCEPGIKYDVGTKGWESLSRYWYHSFNEWVITTRFGHKDLNDLWIMFYRDAICIGLEKDSIRDVFNYLKNNRFKSGLERQFIEEVENSCKRKTRD